jgi:titin
VSTDAIVLQAPSNLVATTSVASSVFLTWDPPPGQLTTLYPIAEYLVEYKLTADSVWIAHETLPPTTLQSTVTGLTNGSSYDFRVAAVSEPGQSPWSTVATITPLLPTPPNAPTGAAATVNFTTAALSWITPTEAGTSPILGYWIEVSFITAEPTGATDPSLYLFASPVFLFSYEGSGISGINAVNDQQTYIVILDSPVTAAVLLDLPDNSTYNFRVCAFSAVGQGPWSDNAVITIDDTPIATPSAPRSLVTTPGNTQIGVSWLAPTSPGSAAIIDYIVQYKRYDSSSWLTFNDGVSTSTTATLTGLTNEVNYDIRIAAVSSIGLGQWSSVSTTAPITPLLPGAPASITSTSNTYSILLNWAAPTPGTANITDYIIQYKLSSDISWLTFSDGVSTATSVDITGLALLSSYNIRIAAVSAVGQGPWSSTYTASTLGVIVPSMPRNLSYLAPSAAPRLSLSWSAPLTAGTYPITDYVIQYGTSFSGPWITFPDTVSTSTSCSITGLTYDTQYYVRVAAVSAAGTGIWTNVLAARTAIAPVAAPTNLTGFLVYNGSANSVQLSWTPPSGTLTGWSIWYGRNGTTEYFIDIAGGAYPSAQQRFISALVSSSNYQFSVAARNAAGVWGAIATITVRTKP